MERDQNQTPGGRTKRSGGSAPNEVKSEARRGRAGNSTSSNRRVTMKDIALRAGVSRATVGFVLSGDNSPVQISEETQRRVRAVADELQYRPNSVARAMRSGRFGSVALILSTVRTHSIIPVPLLDGIHDALAKHDLLLVLTRMPDEKLTSDGFVPKILRESSSDGLIINYNANIPAEMIQLVHSHQIPAVWVNSRQKADCVYPDDFGGLYQAVQILVEKGHRRIAYVDLSLSSHYSAVDRAAGYEQGMNDAGLIPQTVRPFGVHHTDVARSVPCIREVLEGADRPTAVLTYSPHNVVALMLAVQQTRLRVPEDLSVMTVAEAASQNFGLTFDTMVLPEYPMGEEAVEMLIAKINDPAMVCKPRALPLTYQAAQTVAAKLS
ncbi:MAG: LacI family DNA-binding transcriptional regulator [Armatimonadaceae bacterium]